jgi:hypothetical protein
MRRDEQVDMIRHQAVGVDRASESRRGGSEKMQVGAVVGFGKKASVPVDPPLDNMQGHPGHHESSFARHAVSNGMSMTIVDCR